MSGIYIRGMKMPPSCHECVAGYGGCCYVAPADADGICPDHGRADFCPLVPVPNHGALIERKRLNDVCYTHFADFMEGKIDGKTALLNIEREIKAAPTIPAADVAPVRRGRWISDGAGKRFGTVVRLDKDGCPVDTCHCSECGEWLTASDEYPVIGRYCPNCGAKMENNDG